MRDMPVRIVADGVVTRSVRDTAAFFREAEQVYRNLRCRRSATSADPGASGCGSASPPTAIGRRRVAGGRRAHPARRRALLEGLGHHVEEVEAPVPPRLPEDFLLYWALLAMALVRSGRRRHGRSWDRDRLDHLTLGLARHATAPPAPGARGDPPAPARRTGVGGLLRPPRRRCSRPTLATQTPLVGHLDPTQDYDTVLGRLLEWVAFTPLQNATGDPAISLPLATTAAGLPRG